METKADVITEMTKRLYRLLNKHARLESLPACLHDETIVTHRELHIIEAIGEHLHINITDLGAHFGVTKSAASQMVSKLVKKGVVEKQVASHSNKEYELLLTDLGKEAFQLHDKNHGKHISDLINRLNTFSLTQITTMAVILEVIENTVDDRMKEHLKEK